MDLTPFTPERIASLRGRYLARPPLVSAGTVRDFCDSMDHLKELAVLQNDMKDLQRPWAFKTVLATTAPGGRVLEFGAGNPHIAQLLSASGYELWVVDPYDGSGRGPKEFDYFRSECPNVRFVRAEFGTHLAEIPAAAFDCVYSVSVLEHIPLVALPDVFAAARRCIRPGGFHVHAVDHAFMGRASEYHLQMLRIVARELGLQPAMLEDVLSGVPDDPDIYFLSAEAHNQWRGGKPYDEFPMRRCISVNYCVPASASA